MPSKKQMLDESKLKEVQKEMERVRQETEKDVESFWNGLSYEDKLKAFYAVSKRMFKAEVVDQGSYRYALYDVFEFGPDAYVIGMECNYFELHNLLVRAVDKAIKENKDD